MNGLHVVLSGRIAISVNRGAGAHKIMEWRGGDVTGLLPYSADGYARIWKERREPFPLETSVPGVFAAGDLRAGAMNRVASAVGEG